MALYNDLRPKRLKEIFGNGATKKILREIIKMEPNKRPHAFLFSGNSGCGKTTLARILANGFGCALIDFTELDAAKKRDVETFRKIIDESRYTPMGGDSRVFLIDEAHELPKLVQNTLLKTLEDTPEHSYFILCTTESKKIIKTVYNRCTVFNVRLLNEKQIESFIEYSLKKLKLDISAKVVEGIVEHSDGSPRRALVLLEQVLFLEKQGKQGTKVEDDQLEIIKGYKDDLSIWEFCDLFYQKQSWKVWMNKYNKLGTIDPESMRRAILTYMKNKIKEGGSAGVVAFTVIELFEEPFFENGEVSLLARLYESRMETNEMKGK